VAPDDFDRRPKEAFDTAYMRELFALGLENGKSGNSWSHVPPQYTRQESLRLSEWAPMRTGLLFLALLAGCVSRVDPELPDYVQKTKSPPFRPPPPSKKNWDRVELTSEEWLKGEIHYMRDDMLEIDSDELDDLQFEWRKVKVLTARTSSRSSRGSTS
jgi:hypothetical protein